MKSALPRPRSAVRQLVAATRHRQHVPSSLALFSTSKPLGQVHPRGEYYDILITNPIPYSDVKSEGPPSTAKPQPPKPAAPEAKAPPAPAANKKTAANASDLEATKKEAAERARVVFGSRLAGPVERANRLAELRSQSKMIAGVMVPPKPEEPVNCCMSGCVDCVWDRFRGEMEVWAIANEEASRRLKAQEAGVTAGMDKAPKPAVPSAKPSAPDSALSMDDDGGGSDSNWADIHGQPKLSQDFWDDELYKSLPVGIREFMKQEKRMKLKHMENGTLGG